MNPDSSVFIGKYAYIQEPSGNHNRYFDYTGPYVTFSLKNGLGTMASYYKSPTISQLRLVFDNPNLIQLHASLSPDSITANGGNITSKPLLTPTELVKLGFKAIPDTSKDSTKLPINLSYFDSDSVWSSDSTSFSFIREFYAWIYSGGVTKVDSVSQTITLINLINPRITKVNVGSLDSIVVDGSAIPKDQALTPSYLQSLGYKAIPDTSKDSTNLPIHLRYADTDTLVLSESSYSFTRTFYASLVSYGDSVVDSTSQKITADHVTAIQTTTGKVPKAFALDQNYPNPFNPTTIITYDVANPSFVTLKVYNVLGQQVATLVDGEKSPGEYQATFNGANLPSGVYFYRIQAGNYTAVKKLLLLK